MQPGNRIGKYQIERLVAVGGMAEIYLAKASGIEGFEKPVVLKRILPHLAADPAFVEMFIDEARLAATLHHPNVVQVYDIGFDAGSHFFTMERVHGCDLTRVIATAARAGRGLSLELAVAIVVGVAAGLHYAHERGIVHRDVSPSNVLVTFDGGVKLVDFGIAKAIARRSSTRDGAIKGKVAYMSPEQCRGEVLDRRSDLFALGVLLHELTTGKRLWKGDSDWEIVHKITSEDAPLPSSRREGYPPALERIVTRALRRDREQRYPSAEALRIDMEDFAREAKLSLSSLPLARYMRELFAEESALDSGATMLDPALLESMSPDLAEEAALAPTVVDVERVSASAGAKEAAKPAPRRKRRFVTGAAVAGAAAAALTLAGVALVRNLHNSSGQESRMPPPVTNAPADAGGHVVTNVADAGVAPAAPAALPDAAPAPGRVPPRHPAAPAPRATSRGDAGVTPAPTKHVDPDAPWEP